MIALLLAAQVAAAGPSGTVVMDDSFAARTRFQQTYCKAGGMMHADGAAPASLYRPKDRDKVRLSKLADLPKANKEIAINRLVGGCPAPLVVQFNVGP